MTSELSRGCWPDLCRYALRPTTDALHLLSQVVGKVRAVAREAYSREVSSAGLWPGIDDPTFYSYAYPVPDGFDLAKVQPEAAAFNAQLGECGRCVVDLPAEHLRGGR